MSASILSRMTRWIARHRFLVLALWLLPSPVLAYCFLNVSVKLKSIMGSSHKEQAAQVSRALAHEFPKQAQFVALISFHHDQLTADDKPFEGTVQRVNEGVRQLDCVKLVTAYPSIPLRELFISPDGHTQLSLAEIGVGVNDYTGGERCIVKIRERIRSVRPGAPLPKLEMFVTGPSAVDLDIGVIVKQDSRRAEVIVALASFILLIWMFRSGAAAALPIITAALAVMSALTVIYVVADYVRLSVYVSLIAQMTGLALGLDYALLYVTRFKEELARGGEVAEALATTASTAGKAILGSGTLVMAGYSGLFIPDVGVSRSLGTSGILAVFFTLVCTLTLLPALLALIHPYLGWPRWGWFRASHEAVDRFWVTWAGLVIKRPVVMIAAALLVVGLCAPNIFHIRVKNPRHEVIPEQVEARRGMDRIVEVAGVGQLFPVTAVIQIKGGGSWKEKARQQKLIKVLDEIRTWPEVAKVQSADLFVKLAVNLFGLRLGLGFGDGFSGRFLSRNLDHVSMDILAKKVDDRTFDSLVKRLRDRLPEMLADDPALVGWVGGNPSVAWETKTHLTASLPTMIPIVIVVAFLLMALFFRSLVIPTKAVLLNVLSLATTFGILVLVFQHGWGIWILGVQGPIPGALSIITPVVLFCVLFGVSMDYEVFLVARIQEAYRRAVADGATEAAARVQAHRTAIHEGLSRTGGIITNAALVMVLTFAAFLSGSLLPMKEIGFALALAVLIDATLVRMMLVPAILRLVGPATWYWPFRRRSPP